ncbi:flavin reductase family protein [Streptosporangium sp. KLBMP 9127]|nr:flavin reductase family protein [Streptosporangium sp. KLBMP 9127]
MTAFTEAMAQLAAGVAVVTVREDRDDVGATVSSLMSVSLDPPLLVVSLASDGYPCEVLLRRDRWAATLLSAGQKAIASRFATAGRPSARLLLADTPHHRGEHTEAFVIENGVAALELETTQVVPAGDHTLFLAAPLAIDYITAAAPLIRLRSRYHSLP